jgi:MarR family transcriptional regulator, 2-MHQ and catechol-resistance regulon repressor
LIEQDMNDDDRSEQAAEFLAHFGALIRGMDALFRKEMESYDVTWQQFYVLKVLHRSGAMTVTELSGSLLVAAPTASRMIDVLCAKGLLEKTRQLADHRVALVKLTAKSKSLVRRLLKLQGNIMRDVFEGEADEDVATTINSLGRYVKRLHEAAGARATRGAEDE